MTGLTSQATRSRACLLGLGLMGAPMAQRLLDQGMELTGWNRSPDKASALAGAGLRLAATPRQAAAEADLVALCLTDAAAIEAVLFGPDGAAQAMGPQSLVVDVSTIGIEPSRRLAARLADACGARWVDAPVSGGPSAAREGRLAIFCGGTQDDIEAARPLLDRLAGVVTHMGPVGAGQATKLCNQLIVSTTLLAIAEAVSVGRAMGIDVAALPGALAGGYADSAPLRIFGPRMAAGVGEPKLGEIATMLKDVRALRRASDGQPVDLKLSRAVLELYEDAAARGLAHEDFAVLPRLSAPMAAPPPTD